MKKRRAAVYIYVLSRTSKNPWLMKKYDFTLSTSRKIYNRTDFMLTIRLFNLGMQNVQTVEICFLPRILEFFFGGFFKRHRGFLFY